MKIYNPTAINKVVYAGGEALQFDNKGIADVKSAELHANLLQVANYFPVVEEEVKAEEPKAEVEEVKEEKKPVKKSTAKK